MIAEPPRNHLREPHQHGVERRCAAGVDGKRMLMADRFWAALADLLIEPASGILSARFARQRETPLAEALFEE